MKIALIQMAVQTEKEENIKKAAGFLKEAKKQCADIAILPEMFCCPYAAKNFPIYAEEEGGMAWQALSREAKECSLYVIGGSMPERGEKGAIYNTSYVFDREGRQIAKHRKIHLFDIAVQGGQCFKESDTLTAGNEITVFDTEYCKIGVCICYDIRFPELSRCMALEGADMIVVPGAFNMTTGPAHWEILFRTRALDNQVFTVGVAPAREEKGGYVAYGNSMAVSPWGDVLIRLEEKEGIAFCHIDLEKIKQVRQELPLLAHRRTDIYTLEKKGM